ncbi:MAG TPA: hypothetical protein VJK02_15655 [Anaerolineales bacterium]|nr:hypothetical protein [Anaerolineales bacterium]
MNRSTLRTSIIILGLITALVHLVVLNLGYLRETGRPDVLFTLNGLGYLSLLVALFGRIPFLVNQRTLVHIAFIAFTAVTILGWVFVGARSPLGYADKIVEILLIIAVYQHLRLGTESA